MSMSLRLGWLIFVAVSTTLMASGSTPGTTGDVATVNARLKRAEVNLQMVDGAIGHLTSPPKGSAGKLAKLRLDQAFADLDPAGKMLATLGNGAGVAEATERYNQAAKLYAKLQGILAGEAPKPTPKPETPKPAPGGTPKKDPPAEPASKTVKLGYPHADNFKNTLFTLRGVEGDTAALVKVMEECRPVQDQLDVDHRVAARALTNLAEARRQAGFVQDGLAKIPSNGEGVAEAHQRLAQARGTLDTVGQYFEPLNRQLMEVVNPANYPQFPEDLKRLRELAQGYSNPDYLFRDARTQAAEALAQGEAARAECVRIAQAYRRLMHQNTDQGKQIEAAGNSFLGQFERFMQAAAAQREGLPADIRADLAEADRMAKEAVEAQKPMWFSGGIPQRMGWVDDKLALFKVLDPAQGPGLEQEVNAMKASLAQRADSLKELIIRENPLPNDGYHGADRDAVIEVAKSGWSVQEPDFELLAVRIPSETWSRETKWTYSNGTWYFVDKSTLQVRLIVADKSNPELAIDRPVNVRKDHQKGDKMYGVPFRSIDEALQPSEYFLRSRIQ